MRAAADTDRTSRGRLMAAACDVFVERGYSAATVTEIARRAGFTTGALYANFGSKDDLLSEAIADAVDRHVRERLERAIPGRTPGDAAHVLLVDALSSPVEAGDVLVMHALAAALGEGQKPLGAQLVHVVDVIRELLVRGRDEGIVDREIDLDAVLHVTAALFFGSLALKMLDLPAPDDRALSDVVSRLQAVLAPGGPGER